MASDANYFLKKTLGDDFFESLQKVELWKPGTRTTVDHEEIKTALQIVPRVLMAMLIRELSSMEIGQTREVHIPVDTVPALIRVTKHERDVYSGEVEQENKKVTEFKYRSIPGVGLVIMSAFELYDTSALIQGEPTVVSVETTPQEEQGKKIQQLIDERLALHDLVSKVVDKKLAEKDAIKELILAKLTENMRAPAPEPQVIVAPVEVKELEKAIKAKKESPLKGFLERKKKPTEFHVEMVKGETIRCPDCNNALISESHTFSGCVCLGDDRNKKVYIQKSEEGIKVRFGRGWDVENIEMLLEVLRRKRG